MKDDTNTRLKYRKQYKKHQLKQSAVQCTAIKYWQTTETSRNPSRKYSKTQDFKQCPKFILKLTSETNENHPTLDVRNKLYAIQSIHKILDSTLLCTFTGYSIVYLISIWKTLVTGKSIKPTLHVWFRSLGLIAKWLIKSTVGSDMKWKQEVIS